MDNGLYKAQFQTPLGDGVGLIVAQDGVIRGGDIRLYYTGTYVANGNQITGKIATNLHTATPGTASIFGNDRVNIALKGTFSGNTVNLTGTSPEAPGVAMQVVLTKLAD